MVLKRPMKYSVKPWAAGIPFSLVLLCLTGIVWSAARGSSARTVDTNAKAASGLEEFTVTFTQPVHAMSVSPSGEKIVYIVGNELREWPSGRSLKLPKDDGRTDGFWSLAPVFKWRADERELLLSNTHEAALVDLGLFTLKRVFKDPNNDVVSVWWQDGQVCRVLRPTNVDWVEPRGGPKWRSFRHAWYCGNALHYGPRGMMITDVSAGGDAMLVRVVGKKAVAGADFGGSALLSRDPRTGKVKWVRSLPTIIAPDASDMVDWNEAIDAALVVTGNDTAGGSPDLHVVTKNRVAVLQDAFDDLCYVASQPSWAGRRVLSVVRLWQEIDHKQTMRTEWRWQLVLFDPQRKTARTLVDGRRRVIFYDPRKGESERWYGENDITGASSSRDGSVLAYVLVGRDGRSGKLVVCRKRSSERRARPACTEGRDPDLGPSL